MKTFRLAALLAASLTLTNCGLVQAPINMLGKMFQKSGNMLNMRGANSKPPDDFKLETRDVREALADGEKIDAEPEAAGAGLAQR